MPIPRALTKEVLAKIEPRKDERASALKKVEFFLKALNAELKRQKVKAKAVLGGSYAKDTWLSGDYDVDVFVQFDLSLKEKNISDLLERALKKWPFERIHGSRDYFWVRDQLRFEIVPVLKIKKPSDAQNVTDFSPLHVKWVNDRGAKFKGDIRLVKKFCKAAKCYGAESYIRGFSGHVVDILVIFYRGFLPLLKAATVWEPKVVIDFSKVYKGNALLMLNTSKTEGPLVLVDPVQPERNAAAALTEENLFRFIDAAKSFLKNPTVRHFEERELDFAKLAKRGHLVRVKVKSGEGKEDVAGTKLVRAFEFVRDRLKDFQVVDSGWVWDKKADGEWWFVLKTDELPKIEEWKGPPLEMKSAVEKFKGIYADTFTRDKRVWARVPRKEWKVKDVLARLINDEYVRSRVSSVKQ